MVIFPGFMTTNHPSPVKVQVEILCNGRSLDQVSHGGQQYVVSPQEGDYSIQVLNPTIRRQLVVISVDGINVVDGKDASVAGAGYVLAPFQRSVIKGWLRTNQEMATFRFAEAEDSYVSQMGKGTSNAGVIGVAVYAEVEVVHTPPVQIPRSPVYGIPGTGTPPWGPILGGMAGGTVATNSSTAAEEYSASASVGATTYSCDTLSLQGEPPRRPRRCSLDGQTKSSITRSLGTGYGSRVESHTSETTFERSNKPPVVLSLRYATRETLVAWGVLSAQPSPNPFPASTGVPAPAGWRG